jgi:hypothetical protein
MKDLVSLWPAMLPVLVLVALPAHWPPSRSGAIGARLGIILGIDSIYLNSASLSGTGQHA